MKASINVEDVKKMTNSNCTAAKKKKKENPKKTEIK